MPSTVNRQPSTVNDTTINHDMNTLLRISRFLYGLSMVCVGIHQIILKDFRPEILAPFPAWAHTHAVFPVLTGVLLIVAGIVIAGFPAKKICLYLGYFFLCPDHPVAAALYFFHRSR